MNILIAHEAPIALMEEVQRHTDYDYALVHHFENYENYFNFFKRGIANGREVILDNSIFELKTAFNPEKYIEWIEKLQPTFYIVPDVLEDGYQTIDNYMNWVDNHSNLPGIAMGTIQGNNYHEIADCYRAMSLHCPYIAISFDMEYYDITGIGRQRAERRCDGRKRLIKQLIADGLWNWDKPHHLLGCSLAKEFSFYKHNNIYNIRSIDTSNPVIAGIQGMKYAGDFGLSEEIHLADKANEIFNKEEFSVDQIQLIKENIWSFTDIVRQ